MNSTKDGVGQAEKPTSGKLRRTDHFDDMDSGSLFERIPKQVMMAYIDGAIPIVKFRLMCAIIVHKNSFKIKSAYLRNRFTTNALKKYIPELVADGIITIERRPLKHGCYENMYHVNSVKQWRKYEKLADGDSTPLSAGDKVNGCNDLNAPQSAGYKLNSCNATSMPLSAGYKFNSWEINTLNETKSNETNLFNLSAPLLDDIGQVEPEDKTDTGLSQKGENIMPIVDHPFAAVLKESRQKRKDEKAARSNATANIEKAENQPSKAEKPKGSPDASKPDKKTVDALFREYGAYFKGGYGRYDYAAQRNFWRRIVDANLIEEAKYVVDCIHGAGRPPACSAAAERRMSDDSYADYLFDESKAVRDRKERDRMDKEKWDAEIREREATKDERDAMRKKNVEKMLRLREQSGFPKRRKR